MGGHNSEAATQADYMFMDEKGQASPTVGGSSTTGRREKVTRIVFVSFFVKQTSYEMSQKLT